MKIINSLPPSNEVHISQDDRCHHECMSPHECTLYEDDCQLGINKPKKPEEKAPDLQKSTRLEIIRTMSTFDWAEIWF